MCWLSEVCDVLKCTPRKCSDVSDVLQRESARRRPVVVRLSPLKRSIRHQKLRADPCNTVRDFLATLSTWPRNPLWHATRIHFGLQPEETTRIHFGLQPEEKTRWGKGNQLQYCETTGHPQQGRWTNKPDMFCASRSASHTVMVFGNRRERPIHSAPQPSQREPFLVRNCGYVIIPPFSPGNDSRSCDSIPLDHGGDLTTHV